MIERLNRVLRRLGHEPRLDDLRDILWLARHLPPAQKFLIAPISGAQPHVQPDVGSTQTGPTNSTTEPIERSLDARLVLDQEPENIEGAAVYGGAGAGPSGGVRRVRLAGPAPLSQALAVARALRPLGRRRPSKTTQVLDERATAERIAETDVPVMIFHPAWERWFDLVLAVEDVPSLAIWRPTVNQFQRLLERQGAFRSVTRVGLRTRDGKLNIFTRSCANLSPSTLFERRGRRLFLVVSDCTSDAWHKGAVGALLSLISRHLPVAVAQLLPVTLWPNTAVGFADFHVSATELGLPTARLLQRRPDWAVGEPGTVVPVFSLEPSLVMAWARMVMAAGSAWSSAALFSLPEERQGEQISLAPSGTPPADELLSIFRATTLGDAQRLAAYFSLVKPLTLPIMRMVQRNMLPDTGLVALAQVFLGGIMERVSVAASFTEEDAEYDFHPGIRELLSSGVMRSEFFSVTLALQDYLQRELDHSFSFFAYLEDRLGEDEIPPAALPFVRFAREIADRFRVPGSPHRETRSCMRFFEERAFGNGLTVRAQATLPAVATRLAWSPQGTRLSVLHGTGVDVLDAESLRNLSRVRESPIRVVVLAHEHDVVPLEPLVTMLERAVERRSGQACNVIISQWSFADAQSAPHERYSLRVSFDDTLRQITSRNEGISSKGDVETPSVIVLALTKAIDPGSLAQRTDFLRYLPIVANQSLIKIVALPFELNWADVESEVLERKWVGILTRPAASPETAAAVDWFSTVLTDSRLPEPNGAIVGTGWRTDRQVPGTIRLRNNGSELVLAMIGENWNEVQSIYNVTGVVESDWTDGGVLVSDPNGRIWLNSSGKAIYDQVLIGEHRPSKDDLATVRWAPNCRDYCSVDRGGQVRWGSLDYITSETMNK